MRSSMHAAATLKFSPSAPSPLRLPPFEEFPMIEFADAVTAALTANENVVTAIRAASGYTVEQLAVLSGLADVEIAELEAGMADTTKLARLLAALGLSST